MRRALVVVLIALIPVVVVDILRPQSGGHFAWYGIPGFFALFGLIGCVAIVFISKWLGHSLLQRSNDYYDNDGIDE